MTAIVRRVLRTAAVPRTCSRAKSWLCRVAGLEASRGKNSFVVRAKIDVTVSLMKVLWAGRLGVEKR